MRITALLLVTLGLAACNGYGHGGTTMDDASGTASDATESTAMENADGMAADMSDDAGI